MSRCPTDTELLASDSQHVRSCVRCRTRMALLSGRVHRVDGPAPDYPPPAGVDRRLIDAFNELSEDGPQPGQLWRLEFDGTAVPVVVVEVFDADQEMAVAPLGEDPGYADAATVIVSDADSPLGLGFGLWTAVEHQVPLFAADRFIGYLHTEAWAQVERYRRALRDGEELSGAGAPLSSEIDPRLDYRAALERDVLELAQAAWAVVNQEPPPVAFREVLSEYGLGRRELREIGFTNHELGALAEDRLVLSDKELSLIAHRVGMGVQELRRAAPRAPRDLMIELHTRPRRHQLLETGLKHGHGPAQERREAIRGVVMAGKRTRDAGAELDWSDALDKWFAQR